MKNCPVKKCLISVISVFLFLNVYGMVVHGHLLMDEYKATASLWRSPDEMQSMCIWWIIYYALLSAVVTCWFKKTRSSFVMACGTDGKPVAPTGPLCCPIKSGGMCFGLKLGLVMGLGMGCAYLYMPIPASLGIKWFFTGLFEGIGIGAILGMTCGGSACETACDTKDKAGV